MKRAIGYIRVSTDDQAANGVSLDAQRAKIEAYCDLYDLELVGIYADEGLSAKEMTHRPNLQCGLEILRRYASHDDIKTLVILKLDRLTRSLADWDTLVRDYFGENARYGATLRSVQDSIDTSTASGRMVLNIMMTVAQWERETIGERTRAALAHKKATGKAYSGRTPYGFDRVGDDLTPNDSEQSWIEYMVESREAGLGFQEIAHLLNADKIPTKSGGQLWAANTVRRIILRNS
jgi:site-specific DNA recombinase